MLVAVLLHGSPALAADVDLFAPSSSLMRGHGTLQGEAPTVRPGFAAGVVGAFIVDPVRYTDGASAVDRLVPVHLDVSQSIGERVRIDVGVPVYADAQGELVSAGNERFGDIRLGALIAVAGDDRDPVAFGVLPRVTLGSSTPANKLRTGFGGGLSAIVGGQVGPVGWVIDGGLEVGQNAPLEESGAGIGVSADVVAGSTVRIGSLVRVGAEIDASFGRVTQDVRTGPRNANLQGFAQLTTPQGLGVVVGAGTGLVEDVGTPAFRLVAGLSWTTWRSDRDDDAIADRADTCPDQAEDHDGHLDEDGCPDLDNDGDGLADTADACPNDPEDLDEFEDDDGCPEPDNDGDTLVDAEDECPLAPGTVDHRGCPDTDADGQRDLDDACPAAPGPAEDHGCPDTDEDGLHDGIDECPEVPRPARERRATANGCARPVYVTDTSIVVTERLTFPEGRSEVAGVTKAMLDQVAEVLTRHLDLGSVEIQCHTDNVGPSSYNLRLSQLRAKAVRDYLVAKGIAAERLVPRGYGESRPRFTNRTAGGRTRNRRVQFEIRAPVSETGDAMDAAGEP